jgi:uncharacterized protein
MTIDWSHFTPWTSLAGGLLVGLAATAFILLSGRVLGVSSIVSGLVRAARADVPWRLAVLAGLAVSPWVWALFAEPVQPRFPAGAPVLAVAGLLVGWGTRRGSGCTSGHGVCGLSRFSLRSLVATLAFMGTGFATVFVVRHVIG